MSGQIRLVWLSIVSLPTLDAQATCQSPPGSSIRAACSISNSKYKYTDELWCLDRARRVQDSAERVESPQCTSPLRMEAWAMFLAVHPDQAYARYLLAGIASGFRIGFGGSLDLSRTRRSRNLRSAYRHPGKVSEYLESELGAGRLLGPFTASEPSLPPDTWLNPFGLIPKCRQANKWRLIVDLSAPRGHSINDGIDPMLCSLKYSGLDEALLMVHRLGRGCLLAKLDLKHAYRSVPVHPDDWHLLDMQWQKQIYLDAALPFGLRSASKIFSALADGLLWVMACRSIKEGLQYLDDFLLAGRRNSNECHEALTSVLATCRETGFPVAPEKVEGPSSTIVFLGILIDSESGRVSLPEHKLHSIQEELREWAQKRSCTKSELLSHRRSTACVHGDSAWTPIPSPHDRPLDCRLAATPPYQTYQRLQIRLGFHSCSCGTAAGSSRFPRVS